MKRQKHKSFKRHVPIGRAMLPLMVFGLLMSGSLKSCVTTFRKESHKFKNFSIFIMGKKVFFCYKTCKM